MLMFELRVYVLFGAMKLWPLWEREGSSMAFGHGGIPLDIVTGGRECQVVRLPSWSLCQVEPADSQSRMNSGWQCTSSTQVLPPFRAMTHLQFAPCPSTICIHSMQGAQLLTSDGVGTQEPTCNPTTTCSVLRAQNSQSHSVEGQSVQVCPSSALKAPLSSTAPGSSRIAHCLIPLWSSFTTLSKQIESQSKVVTQTSSSFLGHTQSSWDHELLLQSKLSVARVIANSSQLTLVK